MGKKFDKHSMVILGILVVAIVLFIPMFITPYKENDDTWFHLMNIGLIKNSIQENFWKGFSLKILPFVGNNFGYGTRLFYPPLAHTLGAYLSYFLELVQVPLVDALKIFHFVTFFLAGITM